MRSGRSNPTPTPREGGSVLYRAHDTFTISADPPSTSESPGLGFTCREAHVGPPTSHAEPGTAPSPSWPSSCPSTACGDAETRVTAPPPRHLHGLGRQGYSSQTTSRMFLEYLPCARTAQEGCATPVSKTDVSLPTCQGDTRRYQKKQMRKQEGLSTHSSILTWRIPMDRGAWRATVHGVAQSKILPNRVSTHAGIEC